jgi:hypothetical protein
MCEIFLKSDDFAWRATCSAASASSCGLPIRIPFRRI